MCLILKPCVSDKGKQTGKVLGLPQHCGLKAFPVEEVAASFEQQRLSYRCILSEIITERVILHLVFVAMEYFGC